MTTGRFQRSEDGGQTWEDIDPQVMRHRLAGTYKDVDLAIATMTGDRQEVRTQYAVYRYTK